MNVCTCVCMCTYWEQIFSTPQKNISSYESRLVRDRTSYIVLRGRWCNIIVLNMHAPSEEKSDDLKDSFMRN